MEILKVVGITIAYIMGITNIVFAGQDGNTSGVLGWTLSMVLYSIILLASRHNITL